jgi:hypothetical protein
MRPPTATARWLLPIIACGIATAGCRLVGSGMLATDAATANRTATPAGSKPAPRTIHLEVLFIRCADDDPKFRDQLWNHVDEQALGDSLRRSLNANGMRVGIVTGDLPPEVADRLAAASADEAVGEIAGVDPALARRLLQVLPGRRSELVTATRLTNLVLLEQADGEVRGGTYDEATPQFAIEARPAADGRITLEAVPEIKHGPVEKSWVGEDGMFRLERRCHAAARRDAADRVRWRAEHDRGRRAAARSRRRGRSGHDAAARDPPARPQCRPSLRVCRSRWRSVRRVKVRRLGVRGMLVDTGRPAIDRCPEPRAAADLEREECSF